MIFSIIYHIIRIILILALPFFLLIRTAVYLHFNEGYATPIALLGGVLLSSILLLIYFVWIYGAFNEKGRGVTYLRRRFVLFFFIVSGFLLYMVVIPPSNNVKSSEVSKEFYSIQPILRLASSTIFLLDRKAIITDGSRLPEDYVAMGLPVNQRSLHIKQKDGYAYAIDIRTKHRSEVRNYIIKAYFNIMGFNTLRHVGTDDHLHIAMPCRYR